MSSNLRRKLIDIGANLTDPMFRGIYHGSKKHPDDLESVLTRAQEGGIEKLIITGGSLEDSSSALQLANTKSFLYSTVGCHPTRCLEFEKDGNYLQKLTELPQSNLGKIVAVGEIGLDYDRLEFCPRDIQLKYFEKQLDIADALKLPLFLHCRNAAEDLIEILKRNRHRFTNGVVHSFDGTQSEAQEIIDLGLFIGINGCSLKTEHNLEVAARIPAERLMIETDCPWCEIRQTHASFKHVRTFFPTVKNAKWKENSQIKGRNEPVNLIQILEVLSSVRNEDIDVLANVLYENTNTLFFSNK